MLFLQFYDYSNNVRSVFLLKRHGDWGKMGWISAYMRVIRKGKPTLQGLLYGCLLTFSEATKIRIA